MRSIILAIQFLTIIPVKLRGEISERDISNCASYFPIAGALQGLILVLLATVAGRIFPPDVTAGLIITAEILTNGGFHLDGLADTFDGLAVKSSGDEYADRQKRLAVMKDSSTGAIGVVALVTVILLKFTLVKSLLPLQSGLHVLLLFFLMPVYSKWIIVPAIYHGKSARSDGLGRILIDESSSGQLAISSGLTVLLFAAAGTLSTEGYPGLQGLYLMGLLPIGYLFALMSVSFCGRVFGGLTGDNLGALSELSEIIYLAGSLIWLQHSI